MNIIDGCSPHVEAILENKQSQDFKLDKNIMVQFCTFSSVLSPLYKRLTTHLSRSVFIFLQRTIRAQANLQTSDSWSCSFTGWRMETTECTCTVFCDISLPSASVLLLSFLSGRGHFEMNVSSRTVSGSGQ